MTEQLIQKLRADIAPFINLKECVIVKRLPKTIAGKVSRSLLKKIVPGDNISSVTLAEELVAEIREAWKSVKL